MAQFETGKTYTTRSACDYNCIIEVKVLKRTAKTIVADTGAMGGVRRLRISVRDGVESVMPWGSFSMAPFVTAI